MAPPEELWRGLRPSRHVMRNIGSAVYSVTRKWASSTHRIADDDHQVGMIGTCAVFLWT
jgi:hypothetical protein